TAYLRGSEPLRKRWRELAAQVLLHHAPHRVRIQAATEQVDELGQSGLGRHVGAAYHADFLQRRAGGVAAHVDPAAQALGDVHDHHAALRRLGQRVEEFAVTARGVAGAERLEHQTLQWFLKYVPQEAGVYAREEP